MSTLRNALIGIGIALVLVFTGTPFLTQASAHTQATAPVSLRPVFITDANQKTITSVAVGQSMKFVVYLQNNTTNSVQVNLNLQTACGVNNVPLLEIPNASETALAYAQPGRLTGFAWNYTIPNTTPVGQCNFLVDLSIGYANYGSSSTNFTVTRPTINLNVWFYSQYAKPQQPQANFDCGPASIDMAMAYVGKGPQSGSTSALEQVRSHTGVAVGDTNPNSLENALRYYGVPYLPLSQSTTIAQTMVNDVVAGYSVVVLVHGADLGRGQAYGDHFLVLKSVDTSGHVFLNDPDDQNPRTSSWIKGGQNITISQSLFTQAVNDASWNGSGKGIVIL